MANEIVVSTSPHIRSRRTTRGIMTDVLIALVPALAAAVVFFGFGALVTAAFCVLFAFIAEAAFCLVVKNASGGKKKRTAKEFLKGCVKDVRESSVRDLSYAVTGVLLALNLPVFLTGANYKMTGVFDLSRLDWGKTVLYPLVGAFVAIILVKMLFGGIGKNFANPALTARIFLLLCFGAMGTATINIMGEATTGATLLSGLKPVSFGNPNYLDMFLGVKNSAAVGEVSAAALILGGVYLVVRRVIDWRIPLTVIFSAALFIFLLGGLKIESVLPHILSGGLLLGAIFMATDYSTSPNTLVGGLVYAAGIGFLVALIRAKSGSYPEGVSFAIVIMNVVTPLIDKYIVPTPFGKKRFARRVGAAKDGK